MRRLAIMFVLLCSLAAGMALVRPERAPRAELRLVGTLVQEGVDVYEFELTNHTQETLTYWGYEANEPDLECRFWEDGTWKHPSGFRCGTGLSQQSLPAGASIRFAVERPTEGTARIGIFAKSPRYKDGDIVKLEWLPEGIRNWAIALQRDRLHDAWLKQVTWAAPLDPLPYSPAEKMVIEALHDGVVMDLENLFEADPYAAGPPPPPEPLIGPDPFAPTPGGMAPAPTPLDATPP